jgi:hypothetical protein
MAKPKIDAAKLARELVGIHRDHAKIFARIDDIKSQLKQAAGEKGENLKLEFTGLGQVKVSRPRGKELKGIAPEVKAEVFLGLTEKQRNRLIDDGVIVMAEQWSSAYYGAVTVELF